jgi:leucyl/phenylalanyl-tRNA--protein transferase
MPVYALSEELAFPHPSLAEPNGLLAVGGDLSPERLILAYRNGIFPWYSGDNPILWWCPSPRPVLFPDDLCVGRSLRKTIRRDPYRITMDRAFTDVVEECATVPRPGQEGTWITPEMQAAYVELHELGVAHSVEAWEEDDLVGGLYGVSLGGAFFGESMFARRPDASKIAFVRLVLQLSTWGFRLVDCQVETEHLHRFGARDLPLDDFLEQLGHALELPTRPGQWAFDRPP